MGQPQRRFAQRRARGLADGGRGRFFPHFLAASLQRAFALEAVNHALAVAQDLHLDVARLADEAFEVQDRKSTRLNSSHSQISYAVFCLKKKNKHNSYPNHT